MKHTKTTTFIFSALLLLLPGVVSATTLCSPTGYTISTINGILSSKEGAERNEAWLKYFVEDMYKGEKISYQYLLNPKHIGGAQDIGDAYLQKLLDNFTLSDYDLVEMLNTASQNVKTQKLLFVAHSQGNFYANNLHDIVTEMKGGIPPQSVGVYGVATPAGRVAGGGKWLTSDTDNFIAGFIGKIPGIKIMPPNTNIPVSLVGEGSVAGHGFVDVYLQYRSNKIVDDVQSSLGALSDNKVQGKDERCIAEQKISLGHRMSGGVLVIADYLAIPIEQAFELLFKLFKSTITFVSHAIGSVWSRNSDPNDSPASVALAIHKLPNLPPSREQDNLITPKPPVYFTDPQQQQLPKSLVSTQVATSTMIDPNATATSTATSTSSVVVASGSGGGGGGGGAVRTQTDSQSTDTVAKERPIEDPIVPVVATHLNGVVFATTTAQSYIDNPVIISGQYYNNTTFDVIAVELRNTTPDTLTSTILFPTHATTTDSVLSFGGEMEILSPGNWVYRVRLEDRVNASSTPWFESEAFGFSFATTTATSTIEVETPVQEFVFEKPDLNTLSYSDLNDNDLPDSSEEEVVVSVSKFLPAGEYLFSNLRITNGATVTAGGNPNSTKAFKGVKIFAKNLTIDAGASLSADGQGYGYHDGPGTTPERMEGIGASYGGNGYGNTVTHAYGSSRYPTDLGSGSGMSYGHGGGAIKLVITNNFLHNGSISADSYGGGTAGGSIYVETTNLGGGGVAHANGFSLGSGGRIAAYYQKSTFTGEAKALAGCASPNNPWTIVCGQSGTVGFFDYKNNDLNLLSSWRFDKMDGPFNFNRIVINGGNTSFGDNVPVTAAEIVVNKRASVSVASNGQINVLNILINDNSSLYVSGDSPLYAQSLSIEGGSSLFGSIEQILSISASNISISADSIITADRMGYEQNVGLGASLVSGSGASYGGVGFGNSATSTYGLIGEPTDFGSGGTAPYRGGGGAIRIVSSGSFVNNGVISAGGNDSSSGGSIYVTANTLEGSGRFSANGGNLYGYSYFAGPGGGGRIAVYYATSTFSGIIEALGGCGSYDGYSRVCAGNGTVVYEQIGATAPVVLHSGKAITSFVLSVSTSTVAGVIDETAHTINLTAPYGTDVRTLVPTITVSALATSSPASIVPQDFTNPVTYIITAEDGSTQAYVVTVVVDAPPAATLLTISSYTFNGAAGDITADFATTTKAVELSLTANKNVNWMSVTIENQTDDTKFKRFLSGAGCVDGTTTCVKTWDGILSSDAEAPGGIYRIKAHIMDIDGNDFNDYLLPYNIFVSKTASSTIAK